MPRPAEVKPLDNYQLWIKYSDGVEGIVNLSEFVGKGVFQRWDDYREFQSVHIGPDGQVAWGDDIDMCPDALYLKIINQKPEDLFPKLIELVQQAPDLLDGEDAQAWVSRTRREDSRHREALLNGKG